MYKRDLIQPKESLLGCQTGEKNNANRSFESQRPGPWRRPSSGPQSLSFRSDISQFSIVST